MKNINITVPYDEEKLGALKLYLEQRGTKVEDELVKSLDVLFAKNVPANVREFINLREGSSESIITKPRKPREPKKIDSTEVSDNG